MCGTASPIYSDLGLSLLSVVVAVVVVAAEVAEIVSTGESSSSSEYVLGSSSGRSSLPTKAYFSVDENEKSINSDMMNLMNLIILMILTLELHFPFVNGIHFHGAQIAQVVVFIVIGRGHLERGQTPRGIASGEHSVWATCKLNIKLNI